MPPQQVSRKSGPCSGSSSHGGCPAYAAHATVHVDDPQSPSAQQVGLQMPKAIQGIEFGTENPIT